MNAVNAVQLFILIWTFTAVCQADDDISVSCEDVTGTVGEEVTFTCSVFLKNSECNMTVYKFQYPEKYNDSSICREEFPQDPCKQRNSFTCSFSSTTVMTGEFRFFVQTNKGFKSDQFTVDITDPDTQIFLSTTVAGSVTERSTGSEESPKQDKVFGSKNTVITSIIIILIILIIIIIITIIYKKKPNYSKPCGFQRMFLRHKHDDNNSDFQEQNPGSI